jgi:O-antigen/teichoic acid export membrane protein
LLDGAARVFLASLLLPVTGIITAAFLTRRLGTDGYGLLVLSTTIAVWTELTITAFLNRPSIKFVGEAQDWLPVSTTVIRLHLLAGIGGGMFLGLLAFPLSWLFDELALALCLLLYAVQLPIATLSQGHQSILIGIGNSSQKALSNAGRWLARLGLIIFLVEMGLAVPGAILGNLGASLVELAITRRFIKPPFFAALSVRVRPFFELGIVLGLFSLVIQIFSNMGVELLKTLGGTIEQVGVYGAAQNLSIIPGLFGLSLSPLLLSTVSRLLSKGKIDQAKEMGLGAMRMVLGLLPFGALVAGAAPEIVTWVFGSSFDSAAPILAILILGAIAFVMVSIAAVVATASGVPRFALYISVVLLLFGVVANLALIPSFGAIGAAAATALCQAIGALASAAVVYRLWSIVPPFGTLWRSVVISALAYTLAVIWPTSGFLLLVKLACLVIFIPLAYLALREFSAEEVAQTRSFLPWRVLPVTPHQKL